MPEIRINPSIINTNASQVAENTSSLASNQSVDYVQNQSLIGNISYMSNLVRKGPLSGQKKVNELGYDQSSGEIIFDIEA